MVDRGYIDPWTDAAQEQNKVVIAAAAAAAGRLAQGGYTVVFDSVIGPWFLDAFLAATGLSEVDYMMMLLPPVSICLQRVRSRVDHGFGDPDATRHMYRKHPTSLVSTTLLNPAGVTSQNGCGSSRNLGLTVRIPMPALLTRMSSQPSCVHASSTARATDDSSRTPNAIPIDFGKPAAIPCARSADRPVTATAAPACASALAIARPSPLVAPVISTLRAAYWLRICIKLRASGMPLVKIRRYAELVREGPGNEQQRLELLREQQRHIENQLAELQECLRTVTRKVGTYEQSLADGTAEHLYTPKV